MPLDAYRSKRDFARTPEPEPATVGEGTGRFVVQRHRASRLHYDLRLEIGGVLVSWAVPRGPTLDPDERRMAMRTEDHPIEYLSFERVIPAGQYGAGDMIVWDWGTFEPEETDDPAGSLVAGELKFRLHGERLAGRFTIVQTGGRRDASGAKTEPGQLVAHPQARCRGRGRLGCRSSSHQRHDRAHQRRGGSGGGSAVRDPLPLGDLPG